MENISNMTVAKLKEFAEANGIQIKGKNKPDIVAEIEAALAAAAQAAATPNAGAQEGQEATAATNGTPAPEGVQESAQAAAGDTPTPDKSEEPPVPPASPGEAPAAVTPPAPDVDGKPPDTPEAAFVLRRVLKVTKPLMRDDDVAAVHAALIKAGFHCGKDSVEGFFGAQTAAAVRHLQAMNRRIVNGRVDKHTAEAMGMIWDDAPEAPPAE